MPEPLMTGFDSLRHQLLRYRRIFFGSAFFENNRQKVGIIVAVLLILAIPITVLAVQQVTQWYSEANANNTVLFITPATQNLPPNSSFQVMMDTKGQQVGFVRTRITFDRPMVRLNREVELSPAFKKVIQKTSMAEANNSGIIDIIVGLDPADRATAPQGIVQLATLSFEPVTTRSNQTTHLRVNLTRSQVVSLAAQKLGLSAVSAALTINPTRPSPSPSPRSTPSPSPVVPTPSPSPQPPASNVRIDRVMMVNVRTRADMQAIDTNQTFVANIATLPLYTFRFDPSAGVRSIRYEEKANYRDQPKVTIQNNQPFSSVEHIGNTYSPWDVGVGEYDMTVTPYSGPNATGQAGTPLRFRVRVIDQRSAPTPSPSPSPVSLPRINQVMMVRTPNGEEMGVVDTSANPVVIKLNELPKYTFRYDVSDNVQSVRHMQVADYRPTPIVHLDNTRPFSAVGDGWNQFWPWDVGVGLYTITLTPYSQTEGGGVAGQPLTFRVRVE